ncbi:hypothetical protein [Ponticaulis sp.]|uniref:hypothetical protein n=1 Tax=Ponticaulis sp. TaxID=2020902 RepID=UPI000C51626B|nr:hypothetical protein [Ponticaulis sp.]MAF57794.1 hypothetical protein [Ponticaulis sp.]MBN04539.1 hypothetical protein [Ponticaulis sp.]|tara:strand:+ start:231 stop:527 length:297 start_codon:yes stop_codon:yes gene_type:complete
MIETLLDAKVWVEAENNTSFKRSQIQGFLYGPDSQYGKGRHVVRDCLKDYHEQEIWSANDDTGERYDELHAKAEEIIRMQQVIIVSEEYRRLMGIKAQ